jgi:hypothetical protein
MATSTRSALFVVTCAMGGMAIAALIYVRYSSTVTARFRGDTRSSSSAYTPTRPEGVSGSSSLTPRNTSALVTAPIDWTNKYKQTVDYFDFVSNAATRALSGDGRAALYISKALYKCSPIARQYATSANPEADFNAYWAEMTKAPQWILDKARKDFQACAGFIKGDAFASLPNREGGYNSIRFWTEQASASDDPLAQSMQAGTDVGKTIFERSSDANEKTMESAQLLINNAVASRDPAAMFKVGQILSDGHASNDPLQGIAMSIAACNLGYDCTAGNSEIFGECVAQGECSPGANYSDLVKKAVGEEGYVKAYLRAQQIEDAMTRGDASTVEELVKLNPTK